MKDFTLFYTNSVSPLPECSKPQSRATLDQASYLTPKQIFFILPIQTPDPTTIFVIIYSGRRFPNVLQVPNVIICRPVKGATVEAYL